MIYFLCGPIPRGNRIPVAFRVNSEVGQAILAEYKALNVPIVLSSVFYNGNPVYVTEQVATTLIEHGLQLSEIPTRYLDYITRGAYDMRTLWGHRSQTSFVDNIEFETQVIQAVYNLFQLHGLTLSPEDCDYIKYIFTTMYKEYKKER